MAKVKNYHIYGSVEKINRLKEEYDFLGRNSRIEEPGHLVVLALPPRKPKEKKFERRNQNRDTSEVRS